MMHKSPFVRKEMRRLSIISLLLFSVTLSCTNDSEKSTISSESAPITIYEPVDRDFDDIKEDGVLRMITFYSSNTYFLNQGIEVGFEYELLKEFARENDLAVEVIIVGAEENPFDLLNKGVGDVIAANYTITPERKRVAKFTRPYNIVDQMIVYSAEQPNRPQTLEELSESDIPISVRRNSSYYSRLTELKEEGYTFNINPISDGMDTEAALFQVAEGNLKATVADDNMYDASNRYMEGLYPGPTIAESDTIAWAIRSNADELESKMNRYLYKHFRFSEEKDKPRRSTFLNVLRKKYFEQSRQMAQYYNPEWQYQSMGVISPYDELIRSVADSMDLDWLMLTAMIAQESSFNPNSKSWAGAVGLMQIMPQFVDSTAYENYQDLYDPLTNIQLGADVIKDNLDHYSYIDSTEQRWAFALATYNVGPGHMADARRLTIDQNKNPNDWDSVSNSLIKLMQRRHYQKARYGFARGIEPVQYVEEIMNRYRTYQAILALTEQQQAAGFTNVLGPTFNR
ncbi:MAG: transglycosylase SLT domain-containing protein [Balneolaceae bacterium]|nr:transglycosylase SLT domain-containing protein [Balneolaceae bacterium]